MRKLSWVLALVAMLVAGPNATSFADDGFKSVDFPTAGGIQGRADVYASQSKSATLVLLFHQAGWSRGEYREIAPKLIKAGYQVMAVDQRSGGKVNGIQNETHRRATRMGLARGYLAAYVDMEAALVYARKELAAERIIVWGSSYSASLVFRLAAEHSDEVTAVMAFAPGEYFKKEGHDYVQRFAKHVTQPVFVTSAKSEREQVSPIFKASPAKKKILFTPASKGQHGSRALWNEWSDSDVYWVAVNGFLTEYVPAVPPAD
ncbi:MAG: alpha/beta fold hydrolase [Deltaproteobacteria bacterium]|nr:alpha/beta fold hydrolase [Deltaproteobacteria bacterium]